ncbi:hypothetical protein [Streptomyces sp. NPDC088258]|uniref:hypothetical protein n=1 Tax=Streptomyces sp. NPDC088258 TaxID=3365849 RepID=UPI00382831CB
MPKYSVTYPTRPNGVYSQFVTATDPADAVRAAAELDWPTTPGYTVAFDCKPEVWILLRPYRLRSRHIQGPIYAASPADEAGHTTH